MPRVDRNLVSLAQRRIDFSLALLPGCTGLSSDQAGKENLGYCLVDIPDNTLALAGINCVTWTGLDGFAIAARQG